MKRLPFNDEFVNYHGAFGKGLFSVSVESKVFGKIQLPFSEKFTLTGELPRRLHAGIRSNLGAKKNVKS